MFSFDAPWGLGVGVDFSGGTGRRAFGHGGMASSRAFADPECGLVMVIVANGLAGFFAAEQRLFEVTDAVYRALGRRGRTPAPPDNTLVGITVALDVIGACPACGGPLVGDELEDARVDRGAARRRCRRT